MKQAVAKVSDLLNWIYLSLPSIELPGDHRHRIPAQLFDLAIEHAVAILRLISTGNHSSAFALLRCEFECFVRGAWLHHQASDAQIELFVTQDRIEPKLRKLVAQLEQLPNFDDKTLSGVIERAWVPMNGYTHGGLHQISRRMNGNYIEPNFDESSILEVVQFSTTFALLAFVEIAAIAGREDLVAAAQARMDDGALTVIAAEASRN